MSNKLERRGKVFFIDSDLVTQMLRDGFVVTDRVRCIEGLPESAEFVRAETVWKPDPVIALYFVSPDWPVVPDFEAFPVLDVLFQREAVG